MPALTNEPYRATSYVRLSDTTGTRLYHVTADVDARDYISGNTVTNPTEASTDPSTWDYEAGAGGISVTLRFTWETTSTTPLFSQADTVTIYACLPGGSGANPTNLGSTTWSPTITGDNGTATRTVKLFTTDPMATSGTLANRWGLIEIYLKVSRAANVAWGDHDSRGNATNTPASTTVSWSRGYFRAKAQLKNVSLSNASLGGAEPSPFAYPDSVFLRGEVHDFAATSAVVASFESYTSAWRIYDGTPAIARTASQSSTSGTRDASFTALADKVDTTIAPAGSTVTRQIELALTSAQFGGDEKHFISTVPTGWTATSGITLTEPDRLSVNTTVAFSSLTNPDATAVYNRRERCPLGTNNITVNLFNARNQGFAPRGTSTWSSIDITGGGVEETVGDGLTVAHDTGTGVVTFSTIFKAASSAANDTTGRGKALRWRDSQANSPAPSDSAQYGALSTLLTLDSLTSPNPTSQVYNRGETITGATARLLGARATKYPGAGAATIAESWRTARSADGTEEDTFTVTATNESTGMRTMDVTFATSGNNAPATAGGDVKNVSYSDDSGNTAPADVGPLGALSSLYTATIHLQLNNKTYSAGLRTTRRLTSDVGFYTYVITDVNGNPVQNATGVIALRDDDNLVAKILTNTLTTDASGVALDGTALPAWTSALPSGGWDTWADGTDGSVAFTKDGNTATKTRSGTGTSDWTLLAQDPDYIMVTSGGVASSTDDGSHWVPGQTFLTGLAVFDRSTKQLVTLDASPAPTIVIARFNTALGIAQYLDSDNTWKNLTGTAEAYEWALSQSPGDAKIWIRQFSASTTATWGNGNLFLRGTGFINGTPYQSIGRLDVVDGLNRHDKYAFDPIGLFK